MEWKLTPRAIRTLIDMHCQTVRYRPEESPEAEDVMEMFVEFSIVRPEGEYWGLTPRGVALVRMLLNTPLPLATFVDPRENIPL